MKKSKNSKWRLLWTIPELIGELFLCVFVPIYLVTGLDNFTPLSYDWIISISVATLLLFNLRLNSLNELAKIDWR